MQMEVKKALVMTDLVFCHQADIEFGYFAIFSHTPCGIH